MARDESTPRGASYRDELTTAYARIADLEARNRALETALGETDVVPAEHVRDLDATLRRWDRVRGTLSILLGCSGLFALLVAEHWSVHTALLATCSAMVVAGITLAWPRIVRAQMDPKPHARDVSFGWRRRERRSAGVRVALESPRGVISNRVREVAAESDTEALTRVVRRAE